MTESFAGSPEAQNREIAVKVMALTTLLAIHVAQADSVVSADKKDYIVQIAASGKLVIQPLTVLQMLDQFFQRGRSLSAKEWRDQITFATDGLSERARTFALETSFSVSVSGAEFHEGHRERLLQQIEWLELDQEESSSVIAELNERITDITGEESALCL